MSILKESENLDYCHKHHGVGFARKSVSFCQRDNVHVYDTAEYEHDEIEASTKINSNSKISFSVFYVLKQNVNTNTTRLKRNSVHDREQRVFL